MSVVKWYLGNGKDTLVESFWDIGSKTYIHYGIPLLIVSVAVPAVLKMLRRELGRKLISIFSAWHFPGLFITYYITGGIGNAVYCTLFVLCSILTLLTALLYKKECEYYQRQEYKREFLGALPFLSAWIIMHGIYLPNELYLSNLGEFAGEYGSFFIIMFVGSVLLIIGIGIAELFLLPKSVFKGINLTIASIAIMSYVQSMFLNGRLIILNGSEQEWSIINKIMNVVIWLVVVGFILFLSYIKKALIKIWQGICIYIVLIQVVTIGYLSLTTDFSQKSHQEALTVENSLEIAEEDNVLVFVLDRLESKWLQELLDENSEFLKPLSDFTFYRNATSQFADTMTSIPYLLTGTEWQEGMGGEYSKYAYENSYFLEDIKQHNYNIGVYTNVAYLAETEYELISNYKEDIQREYDILKTFMTMWKCSMYKTVPFVVKSAYTYYSSDIVEMVRGNEVWSIENDLPFYESLKAEGLSITDKYPNAFRFYHMRGAHEPYYLSEELQYNSTGREVGLYTQIKGSLSIVYEYLNQLKTLGKYEDATIILTADHGQQVEFVEEKGKPDKTLMPTILVKLPGEQHDRMAYNEAPVSHAEMISTVARTIGLEKGTYGNSLDTVQEKDNRERVCVSLWYGHIIKYTINGDARNLDNWKAVEIEPLKQK